MGGRDAAPEDEAGRLVEALATVLGDLDPELRARYGFRVVEVPGGGPYVGLRDGKYLDVLWSAAEGLQECLMEVCRVVWPECPRHRLGLHAQGGSACAFGHVVGIDKLGPATCNILHAGSEETRVRLPIPPA
ncbi:hypothetical protein [Nonomuraea rhodomycinica]|uniref:Uncharacterized protein n=1 Tax=Nonomuraea rhodomycinica TaxID=1712872 RepID=A0A7Y6M9E2_9ACTN|nr:hypothetical protein [Nonomuraea rhodomycinica]NUW40098.1 hypothetical protein [Nonomuraea rhodomycinica]